MKKQWTKRLLAGVATLALALPIAFGLGQHTVKAADESTTQNVVLTKYGFATDKLPEAADRNTDQAPGETDADPLQGVKFEVYDVTDTYWQAPETYTSTNLPAYSGDPVATGTTDDKGQISFELPTQTGDHNAIYVFHEAQPRAGYVANTSENFMLSLPATANKDDGNVYVYPKNEQVKTYYHQFIKMDGHTKNVLADAKFVIMNSKTEYLKLTDANGDPVLDADGQQNVTGFVNVVKNNYRMTWVAEADATHFISDSKGIFGLDGFTEATKDELYAAVETEAPNGYEKAADTPFKADDKVSVIKDMPSGILPHTGGAGILAILAVGSALIAIAFVGIRKRQARA